ncbi:MAG: hypothetical protein LBS59_02730 [Puniceicoccales bacterium]|jgi:hypothetical protein|nr:hypothetical protein [Puniceicoccales bacterium]
MGNFISNQLVKFLNQRLAGVGVVDSVDLGRDSLSAKINLLGEPNPLDLRLSGIRWSTGEGKFHILYEEAFVSKEWMQGLLNILSQRTSNRISMPDKISLMPLKVMFPKAD